MGETYSIGVHLAGTNLRIASYSGGVDLMDAIHLPTHLADGPNRGVRDMCEAIRSPKGKDYGGRRLTGVGIGSPGSMLLPDGVLYNPSNLPGWYCFQLRQTLESELGRSMEIECDANVASLAEQPVGTGATFCIESFCVLTLGEPSTLHEGKAYVLRAQPGSSAGLLGACLLPYQKEASASVLAETLIAYQ